MSGRVRTCNEELFTVRQAMRELNRIVDRLEAGELEKAVLMRGTRMVAAVVPLAELACRQKRAEISEAAEGLPSATHSSRRSRNGSDGRS